MNFLSLFPDSCNTHKYEGSALEFEQGPANWYSFPPKPNSLVTDTDATNTSLISTENGTTNSNTTESDAKMSKPAKAQTTLEFRIIFPEIVMILRFIPAVQVAKFEIQIRPCLLKYGKTMMFF